MIKNKLLLILILIPLITLNAQENNGKVIYNKKSNANIASKIASKKKNSAAGLLLKKVFTYMAEIEYTLEFNEQSSIFRIKEKMTLDVNRNSMAIQLSEDLGGGNGTYYTNRRKEMLYHQKEFESETYLIKHSEVIDWKLSQEKKKIGIYTCYKATKKDFFIGSSGNQIPINIIAWYSPEIPYSFGPLKYNGLPGLILELSNDKVTFFAKKIYLNIKEKMSIEKPKKGIEISKKKYDSIRRGLAAGFSKRYKRN